ncbi:hypothetical protein [Dictyobacter kobayashii]|uniref:hypothetical protein n=1 Tax=Dictyobacter kobayashii TaxID=2014872 RepID=UPI000F82BEE5|nr:hypothetical protein [Dictyobacter kobayashii]
MLVSSTSHTGLYPWLILHPHTKTGQAQQRAAAWMRLAPLPLTQPFNLISGEETGAPVRQLCSYD